MVTLIGRVARDTEFQIKAGQHRREYLVHRLGTYKLLNVLYKSLNNLVLTTGLCASVVCVCVRAHACLYSHTYRGQRSTLNVTLFLKLDISVPLETNLAMLVGQQSLETYLCNVDSHMPPYMVYVHGLWGIKQVLRLVQ